MPTQKNNYVDTKEIEKYRSQVEQAEQYSTSLAITSQEDYEAALAEGTAIKETLNRITDRKEEITKPLNAALKSVRDLFRPIENAGETALATIKRKMLAFQQEEARKAEEAKRKLAERVERGTMKPETAVRKMDDIKAPEKTVKTDTGKATTRTVKKYRITDKTQIPFQFLEPNMTAIKESFRKGVPVAGVEEYEEQEMAFS
jgi:thiamine pyrophosphate-dependent acetolactate synthase large subunit-like protein